MRKGKLAAQVAHASLKVILDRMANIYHCHDGDIVNEKSLRLRQGEPWYEWINGQFAKIVVYVEDEQELFELRNKAEKAKITHALITDSGKTEFHGISTNTALAIGPDWAAKIDKITGDLPLL